MAIDFAIEYPCEPRAALGTDGILERLKAQARADEVIGLFRKNGDDRAPSEMGFEFERSLPDGTEETQVVIVQDMLDLAAELTPHAPACAGCPANLFGRPFGCYGQISYPISAEAEGWLLDALPGVDEPLVWLLLREGTQANGYDGSTARGLRPSGAYFEEHRVRGRDLGEFVMTSDQVFEMLFLVGAITPAHAGMLMILFGAVPRAVEAPQIVAIMNQSLSSDDIAGQFPFLLNASDSDDRSVREFKEFFRALYAGWRLGTRVLVDA
jgi:hypothetical protein